MKLKSIIRILFFLLCIKVYTQENKFINDSLRLNNIEGQTKDLKKEIESIKSTNKRLNDSLLILQNSFLINQEIVNKINKNIDSIHQTINEEILISINKNLEKIVFQELKTDSIKDNLSIKFSEVNNDLNLINSNSSENKNEIIVVNDKIKARDKNGIIIIGLILIIILIVYIILTKRDHTQVKNLSEKQKEILEKQIIDSQKITDWLDSKSEDSFSTGNSENIDHSFAKRVADEITRITLNLSRMDQEIRGHRQLSSSVRKLEQSLKMNGYEIKKLLNERYDPGMNVDANFITDENLEPGQSIITRVIKPQINYNGKLIQMAQVEVSQSE